MQDLNKAYRELETKFAQDQEVLGRLIGRLSQACKGQLTELDNKLAKLRVALEKNTDLDNISPLIVQVEELLQQQSSQNDAELQSAKKSFLDSSSLLQKSKGLEPDTRRQLRLIIDQAQQPELILPQLLPLMQALSSLYADTLAYLHQNQGSDSDNAQLEKNNAVLVDNLIEVLNSFEFDEQISVQINTQRKRLREAESANTVATVCTDLMRIILDAVQNERSGSEQFLSRLNASLEKINVALGESLDSSDKLRELKEHTEQQIRQQLQNMSVDVEEGEKLEELKTQINSRLDTISNLLEKRSDQTDLETKLQSSLRTMNERLVQLEKEAQQYQVQLNEQHQKLFIDSLTNIPNRAAFDERYELEFERAKRYDSNLNLAVIDIDHFKKINDTFGHTAGDKTLAALGRLLKKWLRSSDFVARYGGEEFVAILPEISPKDCAIALQQLCDKVAAIPFVYRGEKLQITISIGAASADFSKSRLDLFERADKALYQAKNNGRNQIIAADK